jgi:hypothetical protein
MWSIRKERRRPPRRISSAATTSAGSRIDRVSQHQESLLTWKERKKVKKPALRIVRQVRTHGVTTSKANRMKRFVVLLIAAAAKWVLVVVLIVMAGPNLARGPRPEARPKV